MAVRLVRVRHEQFAMRLIALDRLAGPHNVTRTVRSVLSGRERERVVRLYIEALCMLEREGELF